MKRSRIVLFLFGVIAILALLCAVFPEDGFLGLRFPQLGEILAGAEPQKGPSPEELIEQRRQAVLAAERDQYRSFFAEDPARFSLPDDDVRFFDSLFLFPFLTRETGGADVAGGVAERRVVDAETFRQVQEDAASRFLIDRVEEETTRLRFLAAERHRAAD